MLYKLLHYPSETKWERSCKQGIYKIFQKRKIILSKLKGIQAEQRYGERQRFRDRQTDRHTFLLIWKWFKTPYYLVHQVNPSFLFKAPSWHPFHNWCPQKTLFFSMPSYKPLKLNIPPFSFLWVSLSILLTSSFSLWFFSPCKLVACSPMVYFI